MKKAITILSFVFLCLAANAQFYYQDTKNKEMLRHTAQQAPCRTEIIIPQVNGYNVYKVDLHTHTIFSDAQVLPKWRVREAWLDGLDAMAVTEHVEHRPIEKMMVRYLEKYRDKKYTKAVNATLQRQEATEEGIMVDLNYAVKESKAAAKSFGLTIIPGAEITRDGAKVGHFNALFTKDNNKIYDADPVQSVRNAKKQNALVMHNHPGWKRKNLDFTEVEKAVYDAGLVDGVEVMNSSEFYPSVVDRVRERNLFISANSDIHATTANEYKINGLHRPMTLVLAEENTLKALREALESRRTIAYAYNTLCGTEQLLQDLFMAGVEMKVVYTDKKKGTRTVSLTNRTSLLFVLLKKGQNPVKLQPFSTIQMTVGKKSSELKFTVENMFCSKNRHPEIVYAVENK